MITSVMVVAERMLLLPAPSTTGVPRVLYAPTTTTTGRRDEGTALLRVP